MARSTGTPLVPVSSGPPHLKGATLPARQGSMVVDCSQMRRIINVDRTNRVAMCEPGVTFPELAAAVAEHGLRLNTPLLPRSTKSVVANLLDREPVIMPKYQWDIGDPLACLEVVFGTGDVFRTGSAAGPGSILEQRQAGGVQKEAAGPSAASWYRVIQGAQGTMGIVTWASIRCELLPRVEAPFLIGTPHLDRLVAVTRWLIRRRLVNECFILNRCSLASAAAAHGLVDRDRLEQDLPEWILFFNIAGYDYLPELRVEGQVADAIAVGAEYDLHPVDHLGELTAAGVLTMVRGVSTTPYWKSSRRGAFSDVFFLSTYDRLDGLMSLMRGRAASRGLPADDLGVYLQPIVQGTGCHVEFTLFHPESSGGPTTANDLSPETVQRLIDAGAFFSRPYGASVSAVFDRDPATVDALRRVKSLVDPTGLLNPGRLCF